jgi:hypothetical protein
LQHWAGWEQWRSQNRCCVEGRLGPRHQTRLRPADPGVLWHGWRTFKHTHTSAVHAYKACSWRHHRRLRSATHNRVAGKQRVSSGCIVTGQPVVWAQRLWPGWSLQSCSSCCWVLLADVSPGMGCVCTSCVPPTAGVCRRRTRSLCCVVGRCACQCLGGRCSSGISAVPTWHRHIQQ